MDETDVDTLNAAILADAQTPQSATVDGNSVTKRSADDIIKMAAYVGAQVASSRGHFGLRFTTLVPPGCG